MMAIMHKCYNVDNCVAKIDLIQDNFMPVHLASVQHFVDLCRDMAYAFPLPGSLLIYEILKYRPKTLYHTGFACFPRRNQAIRTCPCCFDSSA